jgi:hypothetical protein
MIIHSTQSIHHANDLAIAIDDARGQNYNDDRMKQKGLSRLEDLAQEMVEGTFGRLFGGRLEPLDVANHLAKAIEDNEHSGQLSQNYRVALNPDDLRFLAGKNPHLADNFAAAAQQLGRRVGVKRADRLLVQLVADPKLKRRRIRITTQSHNIEQDDGQITQAYGYNNHNEGHLKTLKELDAFLIVQGRRHILLNRPVVTLGRRTENDIVLDLPSVSRQHAQIRWRFGNFILYDISSHGSVFVNGHPSHEHVLRSGDVIALGEALLVYGEGNEEIIRDHPDGDDDDATLTRFSRRP